ncbi:hypothetical protein DFH11DRAFT_1620129 [Phellopilus nigrolimitatus]|nr:hypothetical protein DFH11DRAFT_1620129 [Phellopilus nigrolimitatus]
MHSSSTEVYGHGRLQLLVNEYELDMVNDTVDNQIVIAERASTPVSPTCTTIPLPASSKHAEFLRFYSTKSTEEQVLLNGACAQSR